jgi:DNA-binding SARP family transcriptional activator/tetratricopeptide (TPR) repeat protein
MLALNANRVTPVELLIDAVWSTSPPSTVRSQVQICISALRKLFRDAGAPWTIRTKSPGYLLEIPLTEVDSEQFASLMAAAHGHTAAGRVTEAAVTLRSALTLWRGPALAGLDSELVRRGAARLEDERLSALTERFQLDLALGRHEEIVGELIAQAETHPLRERLCELLMLALYRSGRQAEALEACRRMRSRLVEELGIEPGQGLQRLESAILNSDPALNPMPTQVVAPAHPAVAEEPEWVEEDAPVVPRRLPASIDDFTGRESQLAQITRILSEPIGPDEARYGVRIVAVAGKGGVGKSTLAIRAAHELMDTFPDGHLYADLEARAENDGGQVLARFLRALGVEGSAIPEDLEERADMYRGRIANSRLLVVLDGVTSEEQALPLLPGSPSCAVIAVSRARLTTLPGAHVVDVDVFEHDGSLDLLSKIIGAQRVAAEREAAAELVNFCGGLPLALRIAGARLASRRHWRIRDLVNRLRDTANRLDEFNHRGLELRDNIGLTYRDLPSRAKSLFRLFALIEAPDFAGWTAAALLDLDLYEAEEVLESLVEVQLLDAVDYPGEHQRYRFHDLIRAFAQEQLLETTTADERRAALSRLLGAWLAIAEAAHRKEYGGDYTIVHSAAPRWQPPGGDTFDVDYPQEWWEAERRALVWAVRKAAEVGLDDLCWDLALTSVTLFEVKGYFDDWRETAAVATEITERTGNRTGRAAAMYSLGAMHRAQLRLDAAEQCFDAALEIFRADGHTEGCAIALRNSADLDRLRGRTAAMLRKYDEALAMTRAIDDPVGEAHILRNLGRYRIGEGEYEKAHELLDAALARCRRANYLRGEVQVVATFAELYLSTDQIERAHQSLDRVLLIVRDLGDRIGETYALYGLGVARQRAGRLDSAESTLRHALSLARRMGERLVEGQALYALGEIELARGNGAAGAVHLEKARPLFAELGSNMWHAKTLVLLSDVHQGEGDLSRANADVDVAMRLLNRVDAAEATRLREELETAPTGLVAGRSDS